MCQIASFYAGAMSEARNIELDRRRGSATGADLVVISADDPAAMVRHSAECRERGFRFAADPSQQIARMSGERAGRARSTAPTCCSPTTTRRACSSRRPACPRPRSWRAVGVRVTTLGSPGRRDRRPRRRAGPRPGGEGVREGRPDRRRRRASAPGSCPPASGACRGSAPPRSAACSRRSSSRPSARRSTRSRSRIRRAAGRVLRRRLRRRGPALSCVAS